MIKDNRIITTDFYIIRIFVDYGYFNKFFAEYYYPHQMVYFYGEEYMCDYFTNIIKYLNGNRAGIFSGTFLRYDTVTHETTMIKEVKGCAGIS